MNINGIPVFEATLGDEECGIKRISLVDYPAVESDFLAFAKEQQREMHFKVADEERRIIRGVIMRADFPIYRVNERGEEYYIVYRKDVIRQMATRFIAEHRLNDVNVQHIPMSNVEGVEMVQLFLKDEQGGVSPAGFEHIEDGSLFAEYHVSNNEVWERVKAGEFRGFSLEGVFSFGASEPIAEANHKQSYTQMDILKKIKQLLADAEVALRAITTDKGNLVWEEDVEIAKDIKVFKEDDEGNRTPAEDGDYRLEDGRTVRVAEGVVVEVIEAEQREEEMAEEVENPTNDGEESDTEAIVEIRKEINELYAKVDRIERAIATLAEEVGKLRKEPAAMSAQAKMREARSMHKTGFDKVDAFVGRITRKN